jgi:phage replication initiation protein
MIYFTYKRKGSYGLAAQPPYLNPPIWSNRRFVLEKYHDDESVAIVKGFKGPGVLMGFVGCADNTTKTPEPPIGGTQSPKPPPNDKEAQTISPPLLNRVLIDFLAFTYPEVDDPDTALRQSGIDPDIFTDTPSGGNGYRHSKRYQNMVVFYDGNKGMGCHISFTGQGCRQFETLMGGKPHCWEYLLRDIVNQGGKLSRIDIAFDNVDGRLSMPRLRHAVDRKTFRSRFKRVKRFVEGPLSRNSSERNSETIQFGSINSRILIKFYNKGVEQEKKHNLEPGSLGRWIRCELLIKDDLAQQAAFRILEGESLAFLGVGVINN